MMMVVVVAAAALDPSLVGGRGIQDPMVDAVYLDATAPPRSVQLWSGTIGSGW
jgi:hypothetical protein